MLKRFLGKRRLTAKKAVSPKTETPDKPLAKFNPRPKSAEEIKVAQTSASPFASSPCGVQINSVDLCGNKIITTLSGPNSNNDTFQIAVLQWSEPLTRTVILSTTRTPGTYTDSFDISGLATDVPYDTVEAVYVCGGANNVDDFSYSFKILGIYRHSQYNTPHEADLTCNSAPKNVCITGISGKVCTYASGSLKTIFESQVYENGSGISINYGSIAVEALCKSPPPSLKGLHRYRANYPLKPSCRGGTLGNTTVARDVTDPNLPCGANICIIGAGSSGTNLTKVVTDKCPACKGKKQIDNYTTDTRCGGIIDLGNFVTVRIP